MKTRNAVSAVLVGILLTTTAEAGFFVGGGVSNSSYDYNDLDNSTGYKIFGGYYAQSGVFVEAASVNPGETEADGVSAGFEADGMAAFVGYRGEPPTGGFGFFGKIGAYSFDTDLIISGTTVDTESSSGLAWALGISYAFNANVAVRGEIEQFVGVEDFANDESITGGSVSIEFRF